MLFLSRLPDSWPWCRLCWFVSCLRHCLLWTLRCRRRVWGPFPINGGIIGSWGATGAFLGPLGRRLRREHSILSISGCLEVEVLRGSPRGESLSFGASGSLVAEGERSGGCQWFIIWSSWSSMSKWCALGARGEYGLMIGLTSRITTGTQASKGGIDWVEIIGIHSPGR